MGVRMLGFGSVFLLLVFAGGCGGGADLVVVEGKVTLDGQPLPNATVLFVSGQGRPASGVTDQNGFYTLYREKGVKGCPPGKYRVQITTARGESLDESGKVIPAVPERVPMRYNVQTELEFLVTPGKKNVANFDLRSGGPIVQAEGD